MSEINESSEEGLKTFEKLFSSTGRIKVFFKLIKYPKGVSISSLGRLTKLNYTGVRRHVSFLRKMGLVEERVYGKVRIIYPLYKGLKFSISENNFKVYLKSMNDKKIIIGKETPQIIIKGGLREYPQEFNNELKTKIKLRDKQTCVYCGSKSEKLIIHHIDENKLNNKENNLVSLCSICHGLTNSIKNKEFLRNYFYDYLRKPSPEKPIKEIIKPKQRRFKINITTQE